MTQAVTELVVRGDGALATLDRYEDKMLDAGQATEQSTGAIDRYNAAMAKFAAAQEKGLAVTTQSVARRTAEERAMERWQSTLSKTAKLEIQLRREAERAAVDMANAVVLGYTSQERALETLMALERRHAAQLADPALRVERVRPDEVAALRAQQAGDNFSRDLNDRLVTGTGKSARDAAAVFSAELEQMETIARMRAEQIGNAFAADLGSRLIAGTGKSARESASVFAAEMDRLDDIARMKAQQAGAAFQAGLDASFGIGRPANAARASAAVFEAADKEMADLASRAAQLRAQIDPLRAAQERYNFELEELILLSDRGALNVNELAGAQALAKGRLDATTAAIQKQQVALRGRGAGSFNTANIAAQFQDIGVTSAMGMNPLQIALQQGTQLSMVFEQMKQSGQGAASGLVAAFRSIISPLALATIGTVALVAVGLQMVDWAKAGATVITALAGVMETIAPYAAMAAAALALLYAPAIIGGIVNLIALFSRLAVSATIAAGAMAAANPGTAFVLGITAAVAALTIFRAEIERAFGVDVVGKIKDVGNYIVNAFRAAFSDVQFIWEHLPTIMDAAARGAGNMLIAGFERAINYLLGRIKEFYRAITPGAAIADAIGGTTSNIWGTGLIPDSVQFDRLENGSAGKFQQDNAAHAADITKIMSQDTLGDFGGAIASGASAATGKLKELAGWLGTVDDKTKKHRGKTDAENYADIVAGADRRISSLLAEQDALGLTEEAAAALRYEQDLLNQAQQKGIDLTPKQADQLHLLASTMAGIEAATKKTRDALAFGKDLVKGFIGDLRSGLEQGKSFWESFGQAASNVLDKVIDKMLNNLIDAIFEVNSASGTSGKGGFFGNLFGWIGKLFGFASGGYTGNVGAHQVTGIVHGGEYVFSKRATDRIGVGNLDAMHRMAKGFEAGGSVPVPANVNTPTVANQNVRVAVEVFVNDDGTIGVIARREGAAAADVKVRQAAPRIVGSAVQQSTARILPTLAKYQQESAGAEYRT